MPYNYALFIQFLQGIIDYSGNPTYERPNVYYEIGYADACEKPLLLIAKKGTKIHFDLQGNKILFYRNMTDLSALLTKALQGLRSNLE